ncbi:hypothetical protein BHE74_00057013 [Ensete ventricosum]|nr:hypothetical protein BHE74_00057013 [Ensete ventricosum]
MSRSPCCDKAHTNKGDWTKEEDSLTSRPVAKAAGDHSPKLQVGYLSEKIRVDRHVACSCYLLGICLLLKVCFDVARAAGSDGLS